MKALLPEFDFKGAVAAAILYSETVNLYGQKTKNNRI